MTLLNPQQRDTALSAIQYRASRFQRSSLINKLDAADRAYHFAQRKGNDPKNDQKDTYSRFSELDVGVVREIVEAYFSYYSSVFLGNSKIFSMTSPKEQADRADEFNTVMSDQQRKAGWEANLNKFLLDVSKYNIGATDTAWINETYTATQVQVTAGQTALNNQEAIWAGNKIERIDPYNLLFDQSVSPDLVAAEGEWAGYVKQLSQVNLFKLIKELKLDAEQTVYDKAPVGNPNWTVYKVAIPTSGQVGASNMDYREPDLVPIGQEDAKMDKQEVNWASHFGTSKACSTQEHYQITKIYIKLVPSAYNFPKQRTARTGENVELWEFHILNGSHVLSSKRMSTVHGMLPIDIGQTDNDSLGANAAGPGQVGVPYQKTAKQMLDRVLAGADRAIRDRGIYDHRYIDKDLINSAIPDAKIGTKGNIPANKSIDSIYKSLPFQLDTTGLGREMQSIMAMGNRAAGVNSAQAGQFVKGNRTLEEYNDVQANAQNKQFVRALNLEATYFTSLKRKIKMNILQYQPDGSLYDPENKKKVEIDRTKLYQADLDFKIADGLKPTEYMLSPNVQQQLLQYFQAAPELAQKYDVMGMVAHILEQSSGVKLQQYEIKQPAQ